MKDVKLWAVVILVLWTGSTDVFAQQDTTYYVTHNNLLHGRLYAIRKYTILNYQNKRDNYTLRYRPNAAPGIGVGVTYSWITVNLAYGLNFLNPDSKGKTDYLDMQIHGYGKKFILDTFEQFYKGLYLSPKGNVSSSGGYYYRPDLKMNLLGASFQYIINNKRFSFRSSFLQSDWQRKSSGSLLVGMEMYGGTIKADSAITPTFIRDDATVENETGNRFFEFGPTVGYAYTVVLKQHFFVTGSVAGSLDYGFNTMTAAGIDVHTSRIVPNSSFRIVTGYNAVNWGISAHFINNGVRLAGSEDHRLTINTGAFRLNYVHRFTPGTRMKKLLRKVKQ